MSRCAGLSAAVRLVAQRVRRVRRMRSCARDGWAARGASAAPPGAARGRPHERRPAGRASAGLTSVGRPVRHMGAGALNSPGAGAQGAGGAGWAVRRPRWLVVERVYLLTMWRASQRAHRWWATTACQAATLDMLAPEAKARGLTPILTP